MNGKNSLLCPFAGNGQNGQNGQNFESLAKSRKVL